ncbi:uncharacterized protein LOC129601046 [Paramacrobiotus metropolitanus]|uniref:uncharacterized protein LOC129601046 n=1 Tax=Paramacrobiotus metropolitanus TaxID=2943436 RepID=UPI0024459FA1|nr:uncharacterized protein LOC129601046 [Paramacrobiotus metropolitanus]
MVVEVSEITIENTPEPKTIFQRLGPVNPSAYRDLRAVNSKLREALLDHSPFADFADLLPQNRVPFKRPQTGTKMTHDPTTGEAVFLPSTKKEQYLDLIGLLSDPDRRYKFKHVMEYDMQFRNYAANNPYDTDIWTKRHEESFQD